MKLRVALLGASGRVGQELQKLIKNDKELVIGGLVDAETPLESLAAQKPDVIIDFSSPEGTVLGARWCAKNKVPLVTGTTGLNKEQQKKLKEAAGKVAVFKSANMGVGVNAMASLFKPLLERFPAARVEFEETHHQHKKDKPSGTALFLKDEIEALKPKAKLGEPVSHRIGEVFGIHKVYFYAEGEWICLEHQATDRSVFARGALKAARWLVGKKPGLYSMKDLLKTE